MLCPLCKSEVVIKDLPTHLDLCRSTFVDEHALRLGLHKDPRIPALFRPMTHDASNHARYISVESPISPLFLEAAKREDLLLNTESPELELAHNSLNPGESHSTSQHAIVLLPDGPHYILAEHDAHEILPGLLYLASEGPARSISFLSSRSIKAVINCAIDSHPLPLEELQSAGVEIFTHVRIVDSPGEGNRKGIDDALDAVIDAIQKVEGRGACLVHCIAGVSRSATTVIAYLMKQRKMSLLEAAFHVKSIRRVVYPNIGFFRVLRDLEREYNGESSEPSIPEIALELHKASQNEHFMTAIRVRQKDSKGF